MTAPPLSSTAGPFRVPLAAWARLVLPRPGMHHLELLLNYMYTAYTAPSTAPTQLKMAASLPSIAQYRKYGLASHWLKEASLMEQTSAMGRSWLVLRLVVALMGAMMGFNAYVQVRTRLSKQLPVLSPIDQLLLCCLLVGVCFCCGSNFTTSIASICRAD